MTNKCKECGGTLVFDADIQMMVCEHCSAMVPLDASVEAYTIADEQSKDASQEFDDSFAFDELMDVKVYECKNCAAQLSINDVEAATYCAYCGQPTVVFSRIEKRKRPQYIIPFKISKLQAIAEIQKKVIKSDYIDDEVKHFKVDLVRGIYIPYGMFCYECHDNALLRGYPVETKSSKKEQSYRTKEYYFRKAKARIGHIPVDASYKFNNESSERLEPFFGKDLVPFEEGYLSGYYADLCDEDFALMRSQANGRATRMFRDKIMALPFVENVEMIKSDPKIKLVKQEYALLPVWFLVLETNGVKNTIMVNGQTGKVVGAVPFSRKKVTKWFLITAAFCSLISVPVSVAFSFSGYAPFIFAAAFIGTPLLIYNGIKNINNYRTSMQLSGATDIRTFVKERQD